MKHQNVRSRLIDSAIKAISSYGMDKTTTKAIVEGTNINEGYIYSYFKGKEDLLAKMFDSLDVELSDTMLQHMPVMYMTGMDMETRCRTYFFLIWQFLLGNRDKCLAYIRYFYSPYFIKNSATIHKQRFSPVIEKFTPAFLEEADVWMLLNHILNVMFDFAVKVHNDEMSGSDKYSEHVFRVLYRSVEQYFIKEEVVTNDQGKNY